MGFSESDRRCKNHPNPQENLGACPSCVIEKLYHLASVSCKQASPAATDHHSSSSSSIPTSPTRPNRDSPKQNGCGVLMGITRSSSSSSFMVKSGANCLKKSRSIAFVPRNFDEEEEDEVKNGMKKKGFWSKFLCFKGKNKNVLRHSTSMRLLERVNLE